MTIPPIEERLRKLLELVSINFRPCNACGAPLYFVRHANGKLAPYTEDGVNHFLGCPKAEQFRKKEKS